jgi:hypothetical protein
MYENEEKIVADYFIQECPICGRPLHIARTYEDCSVTCQHYRGVFTARDISIRTASALTTGPIKNPLLCRVDDLLELCSQHSIKNNHHWHRDHGNYEPDNFSGLQLANQLH